MDCAEDKTKKIDVFSTLFSQYLDTSSSNALELDTGLIETLNIRLNDITINPDSLWFESICKYVYEKLKNEDIFLSNFYRSSQYRKLLLELEFYSNFNIDGEIDSTTATQLLNQCETGSDTNSGDLNFDDDIDFIALDGSDMMTLNLTTPGSISSGSQKASPNHQPIEKSEEAIGRESKAKTPDINLLDVLSVGVSKHYRSHSDCTGLVTQNIDDIRIEPLTSKPMPDLGDKNRNDNTFGASSSTISSAGSAATAQANSKNDCLSDRVTLICPQQKLSAKIINTAINCEGQFAVYAIQVTIIEENQQKSWHVYRRYSRFLDLKKSLVKRVSFFVFTIFFLVFQIRFEPKCNKERRFKLNSCSCGITHAETKRQQNQDPFSSNLLDWFPNFMQSNKNVLIITC